MRYAWMMDSVIDEYIGDEATGLTAAMVRNVKSGDRRRLPVQGVFMAIGHEPNTALFRGTVDLDENGYIRTHGGTTATSVPGVFAAGDVQDAIYRQAITAAGSGCMAAMDAERYLERSEH